MDAAKFRLDHLHPVLQGLDCGAALIDRELRLLAYNSLLLELAQLPRELPEPLPVPLRPIIEFMAQRRDYGPGEVSQLVDTHLARYRHPTPMSEQYAGPGGRILEIRHQPLPGDLGTLLTYRDITHHHQREQALQSSKQTRDSQQRFFQAIEAVPEQFALYDADDRLVIFNSRFRQMQAEAGVHITTGMRFEALIDALLANHTFPQAQIPGNSWRKARLNHHRQADGSAFELERGKGTWILVRDRRLPDGGILSLGVDITERKRIEQALRNSEQRLQDFALAASDWFWEMDEQLRFSWFSEHYEDKSGTSRSLVLGKTREEIRQDAGDTANWLAHQTILDARQPFRDFEYLQNTPQGLRWMRVNGLPIVDEHGKFCGYRGTGSDITALREATMAAQTAQNRFLQAIEAIRDTVIALFDANDSLVACNSRFGQKLRALGAAIQPGISFETFINLQPKYDLLPKSVDPNEWVARRMAYHQNPQGSLEMQRRDDAWMQVREQRLEDGSTLLVGTDISELKRSEAALRASEARFRDFAELAADVFWETDAELRYAFVSEHCQAILGVDPAIFLGVRRGALFTDNEHDSQQNWQQHLQDLQARRTFQLESAHRRPDNGQLIHIRTSGRPIFSASGQFLGYRGIVRDITQEHTMLAHIQHQATHDALTGLVNRHEFEHRLENALQNVRTRNTPYALCFMDLDRFKVVNDTAGHHAGDQLLQQLTGLLLHHIRGCDTLARLGGDEFGLLLENCPLEKALRVAETLVATVSDYRFTWEDQLFQVSASIGVVALSDDLESISEAMTRADTTCYTAKEQGRSQVQVWRDSGELPYRHQQIITANQLRDALLHDQFCLLAQPVVSLSDRQPHHWEILLRLRRPDGQIIPPGVFMPAAERYGMMASIDHWVLREALARRHQLPGGHTSSIAMNLSPSTLRDTSLIGLIHETTQTHDVGLGQIIFEITESTAMTHLSRANEFLREARSLGCRLALDNFGSGLASLTRLHHLPVDYLKIDGRLVRAAQDDPIAHTMLATLAQVGRQLDMITVAAGMEDQATTPTLRTLGIPMGQGYAFGEPQQL